MELLDAVDLFTTETFTDVITPTTSFKGKLAPFTEITNSGPSSERRILETLPTVTLPESRAVTSPAGQVFIAGYKNEDFWDGALIRNKYPVIPSRGVGIVGSAGEMLAVSIDMDYSVHSYPYFVRREILGQDQSDFLSGYEIYMPSPKFFVRGLVLWVNDEFYRLKTDTWIDGAGFSVAQAVKLETPLQNMDIVLSGTDIDPVTDSYPSTRLQNVKVFIESLLTNYDFVTPTFTGIEAGDKAISFLSNDVPGIKVNDQIGDYRIISLRETSATAQAFRQSPTGTLVDPITKSKFYVDYKDSVQWVTAQCRRI